MGDFPMMTDRGTFIINGTERIVVSQLVRSPGVYFGISPDKTAPEKDIVDAKMIPGRGAWLEFEVDKKDVVVRPHRPQAQAARHRAAEGARVRRDRRRAARPHRRRRRPTRTSRSATRSRRTTPRASRTRSSTSTASCAPASRRLPTPPASCSRTSSSTRSATTSRRSGGTRCRRSSPTEYAKRRLKRFDLEVPNGDIDAGPPASCSRRPTSSRPSTYLVKLPHEGADVLPRRHRPLRQPPGALGG